MSRGSIVLVLVALLVGGAIGYVLGDSASPPSPPGLTDEAPREAEPERRPATRNPEPLPPNPTLAQVLESLPTPAVPTGDGVITGRVTTKDGQPVAGVLVRATRSADLPPLGSGRDPTLEERVRRYVARARYGELTGREAITDGDGAYRLERLTDAEHSLSPRLEGYVIRPVGRTWRASPGETLDFHAEIVARAEFVVTRADGAPVGKVEIHSEQDGRRSRRFSWDPRAPHRDLDPGAWTFQARSEDGAMSSEPVSATLVAGGGPVRVALTLVSRPGVRGRVVFEDGAVPQFLSVHLFRAPVTGEPRRENLARGRELTQARVHARDQYAFVFPDLDPGRYVLGLFVGGDVSAWTGVMVVDRMVDQDLPVPPPDPAGYVLVRVLGPDGEDAGDVRLTTAHHSPLIHSSGGSHVERMPDGRWRVYHHSLQGREAHPDGRDFIRVRSEAHGTGEIAYRRGVDRDLTVKLEGPTSVRVTVPGLAGTDFEGDVTVSLLRRQYQATYGSFGGAGKVDGQDRWLFEDVAPGEYEIRLRLRVGRHGGVPVARAAITVTAGANEQAVPLPRLYPLVVDPAVEGTTIRVRPTDDLWSATLEAGEDGRHTLPGLPAGTYFLTGVGQASRNLMPITVPTRGVIRFEPKASDAIQVLRLQPGGFLARLGLRDGDLIVAIDGVAFESYALGEKAFYAKKKDVSRLTIVRQGRTRVISADLRPLTDGRERGGATLRPALHGE